MKRLLSFALLLALPVFAIAQDFTILESDAHHLSLRFELNDFIIDTVRCNGELMHAIRTKSLVVPNEYGLPDLPTFNRFIAIPQGATAIVEVRPSRSQQMEHINIMPSVGSRLENEEEKPFFKDPKCYEIDELYPAQTVLAANPQSMRGVDVIHLGVSPIQFNPVRQELTISRQLDIEIRFEGGNGHFGDDRLRSPYWDPILQNNILNAFCLEPIDYHARMQEWTNNRATGCEYLILTPNNEAFIEAAQELADYRTRQGILTKAMRIGETGATTPGLLRHWFREIYNNWDIPPAAVCILGETGDDMQQYVPAFRTQHPKDGFISSDNPYADIDDDNLPDISFSRLVAQTNSELSIFIGKQIEYEYTNPCMSPYYYMHPLTASAWQTTLWFQITISTIYGYLSQHGKTPTRLSEIHSGELSDQWSSANGTNTIVSYFGPDGLGYIPATPGELGGWTGATAEDVIRAFNRGAYIIQHRDHGWTQKWYQPEIYVSDFSAINNPGQMPFLISINCKTGQYDYSYTSNCFTEALMRMTRDGQNAGIVGAISPTGQTYSFANDVLAWGIWDLFDPSFLPEYGPYATHSGLWMPSFACVSGKYFLEANVFPYTNETMRTTIYNTFHSHCDAFLRIFTDIPQNIEAQYDTIITPFEPFHFTVPEGVQVAISSHYGGKAHLLATATGTGEEQTITILNYIPSNTVTLTMTGQNLLRREESIPVIPIDRPFVVADSVSVNGSELVMPFGQSATVDLSVKNVGTLANEAGTAILSSHSDYFQAMQNQTTFPAISPDESHLIENAFQFNLTDDIPDQTEIPFSVTTQFGDESFEREFSLNIVSPVIYAELLSISDPSGNGNGRLDPGEYASLTFNLTNIGHYLAEDPTVTLLHNDGYIHVITPETTIREMSVGESKNVTFDIYVEFTAGLVQSVDFTLSSKVHNLVMESTFTVPIGFTVEDFETTEFNPEFWDNDPEHPWIITTNSAYEGYYCARSATITDDESSFMTLHFTSNEPGEIAFYSKTSSEANYDFLIFSIDDEEQERWSGDVFWHMYSYPVSPGTHYYTWTYSKDYSVNGGSDAGFVDYITLPPYLDKTAEQTDNPLALHPNPTTDLVYLEIEQDGDFTVNVYDAKGQLVISKQNENKISFGKLPAGMYHIEVVQNGQRWSRKMIKM